MSPNNPGVINRTLPNYHKSFLMRACELGILILSCYEQEQRLNIKLNGVTTHCILQVKMDLMLLLNTLSSVRLS